MPPYITVYSGVELIVLLFSYLAQEKRVSRITKHTHFQTRKACFSPLGKFRQFNESPYKNACASGKLNEISLHFVPNGLEYFLYFQIFQALEHPVEEEKLGELQSLVMLERENFVKFIFNGSWNSVVHRENIGRFQQKGSLIYAHKNIIFPFAFRLEIARIRANCGGGRSRGYWYGDQGCHLPMELHPGRLLHIHHSNHDR